MIVVDASALMAILLEEDHGPACLERLAIENDLAISAVTMAEFLIVAGRHGIRSEARNLLSALRPDIVPVTAGDAAKVSDAFEVWGQGVHAARLNFADCFAYALAKDRNAPMLFVGDDFSKTDIEPALP